MSDFTQATPPIDVVAHERTVDQVATSQVEQGILFESVAREVSRWHDGAWIAIRRGAVCLTLGRFPEGPDGWLMNKTVALSIDQAEHLARRLLAAAHELRSGVRAESAVPERDAPGSTDV